MKHGLIAVLLLLLPLTAVAETGFTQSVRANRKAASGNRSYHEGRYEEARAGYLRAKDLTGETEPEIADLHFNIGATFYKEGNFEAAESEFQQAAGAADPILREQALYNLGNVAFQQGIKAKDLDKLKKAAEYYQQALQLNPEDEDARFNLEVVRRHINLEQQKQQPRSCPNPKPGGQGDQDQQQPNQQDQANQQDQTQQGQQQQQGPPDNKNDQQQAGQQQQQQEQKPNQRQPGAQQQPEGQDQKKPDQPQPAAGGTTDPKKKKDQPQPAQPVQPAGSTQRQGKLTAEEAERILQAMERQEQEDMKQAIRAAQGGQRSKEKDW